MDFHAMKRDELQALCKKHKIPANLKNIEMANRLASLFKVDNEKPKERKLKSCLKNLDDERNSEGKEAKKVRISPQNQTFEFEKTNPRAVRLAYRTRKSMVMVQDEIKNEENVSEIVSVDNQVRNTRTRGRKPKQTEEVEVELLPKKKEEENDVSKRMTRKRTSIVADLVGVRPEKAVKNSASEAKPVTRRSARNSEKPVDSVEQVEIVKVPKRKTRSDGSENMGDEKAPTRCLRRNTAKDTGERAVKEAKEQVKEEAKVIRNTRRQKKDMGLNETVPATDSASAGEQCQQRRSTRVGMKRSKVEPERMNDKKSDDEDQERGVSLRNKQPRKQENSRKPGKSDVQTKCVGKRKMSTVKHVELEDFHTDSLAKSVDISEAVDIQNMLCKGSSAVEDDQGKNQTLHQTISPTLLPEECEFGNAEERLGGTSASTEAKLNTESTSENDVSAMQPENSDGETTKADEKDVDTVKEEEYNEAEILNGDSSEDAETVLFPSSGFKSSCTEDSKAELENSASRVETTSPTLFPEEWEFRNAEERLGGTNACPEFKELAEEEAKLNSESSSKNDVSALQPESSDGETTRVDEKDVGIVKAEEYNEAEILNGVLSEDAEIALLPSSGFKSPCTEGSKAELENSASKADNFVQCVTSLTSTSIQKFTEISLPVCEPGFQGMYETQDETATQSSLIVQCDPNGELSSIKSNDLEEHNLCADTIMSNEQIQLTCTNDIVDSAAAKENQSGDVSFTSRDEGILPGFSYQEGQNISNDVADLKIFPALNELQSKLHKLADTLETSSMVSNEPVDSQADKCIDHLGIRESGKSVGYTQDTGGVTSKAMVDEIIERSEGIDTCINDTSDDPAEHERNYMQEYLEESNLQTNGIAAEKDSVVISNEPPEWRIMADAQLYDSHEDEDLVDQNLEVHEAKEVSIVENIQEAEEVVPTAMVDERSEGIDTCESSDFTADCDRSHKQGLEEANSQLTLYGFASLFHSEYAEDDTVGRNNNSIEVSDAELNNKEDGAVLADQNPVHEENAGSIVGNIQDGEDAIPTAMVERSEEIDTRDSSDDTADCERSHKQELEDANSHLISGEETYDIASLFQSEYAEDDVVVIRNEHKGRNLIEDSDVELNNNHEDAFLAHANTDVCEEKGESCRETHEVSGRLGDEEVCMEEATLTGLIENSIPHNPTCSTSPYNSNNEMELVADVKEHEEFSSAGYKEKLSIQQSATTLNDDAFIDEAGQSDHENLAEKYSGFTEPISMQSCGHIDHTESDSLNSSEDKSLEKKDSVTSNIHLLVPCQNANDSNTITQEDNEKVASDLEDIVAGSTEATEDGVTPNPPESEPADVNHPMDWEDDESHVMNKVAVNDLEGSEQKSIIQSSAEKANICDEHAKCDDSRASVELIAPFHEALKAVDSANQAEPENDLIGLAVLESIAEKTEQQRSCENLSLTSEPQEADGENISLTHEPEEAVGEKFSLPEPEEADRENLSFTPEVEGADGMNLSLSCEADGAEGDNYSLGPELEGADKKESEEAQIHYQYTSEDSESVLPCSGALKKPPLEEAGELTPVEKLTDRLDGVCVNSVTSDIIDSRREYSSAGYEDSLAPQNTAMTLNDDAYIYEAGQSDQQNLTEMCRGHMDHTKSDSWNSSEDESRNRKDAVSPNVHLLFSCNTITQEDSGKVDILDYKDGSVRSNKQGLAMESNLQLFGHEDTNCGILESKVRLCQEGESRQSPGLVQENSESMEIELTSYETALFMGDGNFGDKTGTLEYQTSEMNLMTCNLDVSQNEEDQIDTEQVESDDIHEQGCDSSELTLPASAVCDKAESVHRKDDVPAGDFSEPCEAKHEDLSHPVQCKPFEEVTGKIDHVLEDENAFIDQAKEDTLDLMNEDSVETLEGGNEEMEASVSASFPETMSVKPDDEYKNDADVKGISNEDFFQGPTEECLSESVFEANPTAENMECDDLGVTFQIDAPLPKEDANMHGISKEGEITSQLEMMKPLDNEVEDAKLDTVQNSFMKMNKRNILIHGTPRRPIKTADMKENSTAHLKREHNLADATAMRPIARRKALMELHRR